MFDGGPEPEKNLRPGGPDVAQMVVGRDEVVIVRILRVGSDVRIVCQTCGRDMTVNRIKLEKAIRQVLPAGETADETKKGSEQTHE